MSFSPIVVSVSTVSNIIGIPIPTLPVGRHSSPSIDNEAFPPINDREKDPSRIEECIAKKNLSCISTAFKDYMLAKHIALKSDIYTFKLWEEKNLKGISDYLPKISKLETCMSKYPNLPIGLSQKAVDYFKNYFNELKKERNEIEELNTFANTTLNEETAKFITTKLKIDFDKFRWDLEKTEEHFKSVLSRRSVSGMVSSLSRFIKEAVVFSKGKCDIGSLDFKDLLTNSQFHEKSNF